MHFHLSTYLPVMGAIVPLALANFDIYADQLLEWNRNYAAPGFRIFGGVDSGNDLCKYVNNPDYNRWPKRDDVSYERYGIRCEGEGCDLNHSAWDIDTLEMNFATDPAYHWTVYKDRASAESGASAMNPLEKDGPSAGFCYPFTGDSYNCEHKNKDGFVVGSKGVRKFRCITNIVSDDINAHKPQSMGDYYPYKPE